MEPLDLGNGHTFEFTWSQFEATGGEGEPCGGIHNHPRPDNSGPCAGAVMFRGKRKDPGPEWDVLSMDPLTLSPSLLCRTCGRHGYIRQGRWEEC